MLKVLETHLARKNRLNMWFEMADFHLNVYIRITQRVLGGVILNTIDIANIEVDEEFQKCGNFSRFLSKIEELALKYDRTVYVECIQRDFLIEFLKKLGYVEESFNCLYKKG